MDTVYKYLLIACGLWKLQFNTHSSGYTVQRAIAYIWNGKNKWSWKYIFCKVKLLLLIVIYSHWTAVWMTQLNSCALFDSLPKQCAKAMCDCWWLTVFLHLSAFNFMVFLGIQMALLHQGHQGSFVLCDWRQVYSYSIVIVSCSTFTHTQDIQKAMSFRKSWNA